MKNTGLLMPEKDQIYVRVGFSYYLRAKIIGKSFSILCLNVGELICGLTCARNLKQCIYM